MMNENNETETEEPTKEELATRVEQLEATVEKMIPTRREALGMGASAVAAGGLSQLLFGTAKAGSQQSGTIGSQSNVQDWYVEDLYDHNGNQALSLPGNGSVEIDQATINDLTGVLEKTTDQSISSSTTTPVDWDSQDLDTNIYSYDSSNDTLDVLVAGDYSLRVQLRYTNQADGDKIFIIVDLNGSEARRNVVEDVDGSNAWIQMHTPFKDLSANDTIEINARSNHTDGGTVQGSPIRTFASITREG